MNWDVLEDEVLGVVVCEAEEYYPGLCGGGMHMARYSCCNPLCALYGDHGVALCPDHLTAIALQQQVTCACGEVRHWKAFFRDYWLL